MATVHSNPLQMLGVKQLCALLGISRATLYRWVKDGLLPAPIQLGPRRVAFPIASIEQFISSRSEG
jgi:excisionase family DNA binding protein